MSPSWKQTKYGAAANRRVVHCYMVELGQVDQEEQVESNVGFWGCGTCSDNEPRDMKRTVHHMHESAQRQRRTEKVRGHG